jgi:glycosyltransferase involved in cell wall biosynthesis
VIPLEPPKNPMRILLVAGGLSGGGAERQLRLLAVGLAKSGDEVTVGTLAAETGTVEELDGVRHVPLWDGRRRSPLGTGMGILRAGCKLDRALVRFRPDVAIGWLAIPIVLTAVTAPPRKIPFIATIRNAMPERLSSVPQGVQNHLLGWAIRRAAGIVANSRAGLERYRETGLCPSERGEVIRNAIDLKGFRPPSQNERSEARSRFGLQAEGPVALYVGRLAPEKRIHLLLATVRASFSIRANLQWLIVGIDPIRLRQAHPQAHDLLENPRVICLGGLKDIHRAYWAADVLALTSEWEGSPNVVAEALASGLPIVSTGCGDVAELVAGDGLIAEPDPQALARAIITLAAHHRPGQSRDAARRLATNEACIRAWRESIRAAKELA